VKVELELAAREAGELESPRVVEITEQEFKIVFGGARWQGRTVRALTILSDNKPPYRIELL